MKKELKKDIYETVSTLRNLVERMKVMIEEGIRQKTQPEKDNSAHETELETNRKATQRES